MAKRQNHKQARIGKEMQATLDLIALILDPAENEKLQKHYDMLLNEWTKAGRERR